MNTLVNRTLGHTRGEYLEVVFGAKAAGLDWTRVDLFPEIPASVHETVAHALAVHPCFSLQPFGTGANYEEV